PRAACTPRIHCSNGGWADGNMPRSNPARRMSSKRAPGTIMSSTPLIVAPDAVAHHHAILGIKEHEAFRYAFYRVANGALRPLDLLDQLFLLGDVTSRSDHAIGAPVRVAQRKAVLTRPTPLTGTALVSNIAIETFGLPFEMRDEGASISLVILRVKQRCPMLRLGKLVRVDLQVLSHRR